MENIDKLLKEYRATGRLAFYHPRKQTISLNGGKHVPVKEALKKIRETLRDIRPLEAERLIAKGRLGGGSFRFIPAS